MEGKKTKIKSGNRKRYGVSVVRVEALQDLSTAEVFTDKTEKCQFRLWFCCNWIWMSLPRTGHMLRCCRWLDERRGRKETPVKTSFSNRKSGGISPGQRKLRDLPCPQSPPCLISSSQQTVAALQTLRPSDSRHISSFTATPINTTSYKAFHKNLENFSKYIATCSYIFLKHWC